MVRPAFEARVVFPRTGGVMSSLDMSRQSYLHGNEVLYRQVLTYKCEQIEGLSHYDFGSIIFKVITTQNYYRIVVDKDESNQEIQIIVEGIGVFEGKNLSGTFKQFPIPSKPITKKPIAPKRTRRKTKGKKETIGRTNERVAVSILTFLRPDYLRQCLESILPITMPLKVIITNQADYSKKNMALINKWKDRPQFHYRVNDPPKWPGASRAEVFRMAKKAGFEYIVTLDDDCRLLPGAINKLVKAADDHPEFYAISGYLITPHRGKYMLGGSITVLPNRHVYKNYDLKPGVQAADFISNGFRLIRLEPLVVPDGSYTIGLTDFDWAEEAKSRGLRLAVCGDAGAYHKFMFIDGKPVKGMNPENYRIIRRNRKEIQKMRIKFEEKWGFKLK